MALSIWSSDSDDSDLEALNQLSDWDTDSSSEDVLRRASSKRIRRVNYMQSLEDAEFTFRFRLSKSTVSSLLNEIMPHIRVTSSRNHGVPPLHQLLLTLRFYALGTMLISVAKFVDVSVSTAGRIVYDISSAIAKLYDVYIYVHQQSTENFFQIAQFPRVLAAIDCTHVRLQSPSHVPGEEFRNCKGYYSLNIQAICDADLKFMNVVSSPGSVHDATIFNNSSLRAQFEAGQFGDRWMLGDSAYPNRPYLLTPLLNPITIGEQRYNEAHIKTRNTIERTFVAWKCRFPVVALTLRLSLLKVQEIVIATAVLHNICRDHNLEEISPEVELPSYDEIEYGFGNNMDDQDNRERTSLILNYFS